MLHLGRWPFIDGFDVRRDAIRVRVSNLAHRFRHHDEPPMHAPLACSLQKPAKNVGSRLLCLGPKALRKDKWQNRQNPLGHFRAGAP
jgi:hypothetical protein